MCVSRKVTAQIVMKCDILTRLCMCVFRPVLAPGEGEGGETPAENPAGTSARSAEEPQRGRHTDKGTAKHTMKQDMMSLNVYYFI